MVRGSLGPALEVALRLARGLPKGTAWWVALGITRGIAAWIWSDC